MKIPHPEEPLQAASRRTHRCHSQALWKPRGGRPEERAKSTHSFRSSEPAGLVDEVAQRLAGEEAAALVEDDLLAPVLDLFPLTPASAPPPHLARGPPPRP